MTKSKQRQKVGGAVLVMVLIVMVVLIIMLLATLTVVTTASQRIYTKYEENQAYYSARSALDIFTQNMLNDNVYIVDGRTYTHTTDFTTGTTKTDPMKQGLALQLDLYKIKSQGYYEDDATRLAALDALHITNEDDKRAALDFVENMELSDDVFGGGSSTPENTHFTVSNVALNDETDAAKQKDYIEYKVTFPAMSDGSDAYGKLADEDRTTKVQEATIKVEVLSRVYNTSPAYSVQDMMTVVKSGTSAEKQALKDAIKAGSRSKDQIRLKITSTVEFQGIEGTAVLVHDSQLPPVINSSRAVTTFGGTGLKNMNIIGGIATLDPVNWDNTGSIYGAIYGEQNWNNTSASAQIYLTDNECYYIGGSVTADNSGFKVKSYALSDVTDKDKRPFVFIDNGSFTVGNSSVGGSAGLPAEKVDLLISADPTAGVPAISGYNTFEVNGDVYVKGDVDLSGFDGFNVNGDIYIDGNLNVVGTNHGWTFSSDVLMNGGAVCSNVYMSAGSTINSMPITASTAGVTTFTNTLDFTTDKDTDTDDIDIELPNGVKKVITSHASMYNDYYQVDSSENILLDGSGNPIPITAEQKAFTTNLDDLKKGNYSTKQFTETDIGITSTLSVENNTSRVLLDGVALSSYSDPTTGISSAYALDTAGTNVKCVMTPSGNWRYGGEGGDKNNYMYIHGGGVVELLMQPQAYGWEQYKANIVVADDTTLIVYGSSGNYKTEKFCIWSETVFNAYKNNTSIDVGMEGDTLKVPKIFYYFSDGSKIDASNEFFLTGYFYGPGASFEYVRQEFGINMEYNDNPIGAVDISFVGSVLCKDLLYDNALGGVAYINPEYAESTGGDPILDWAAARYTRN